MSMSKHKERVTWQLREMGVPAEKAVEKYHAWQIGKYVAYLGAVLAIMSFVLVVVPIVVLRQSPEKLFLFFAGLGFIGGLLMVFIGGVTASGEAMAAAGKAGGILANALANAISVIRRKPD